jgi:hypothetical protein
MSQNLYPYSFAVFIARRSGGRRSRDAVIPWKGRERVGQDLLALAEDPGLSASDEYVFGQQALRRCLHLISEMRRIADVAPVACAITGRAVVETALVGAFVVLYGSEAGSVAGLMKSQRRYSRRLRDYFLGGNTVAALALLPEVSFVADPLRSEYDDAGQTPDLKRVCELLDKKSPFTGNLATQIYNETYSLLSNRYVHATPQSVGRYRDHAATSSAKGVPRFSVAPEFPTKSIIHAVLPVIGALASCLASVLGQATDYFDQWFREVNNVDGYDWSGSLARTAAVEGLAELAGLLSVGALNAVGITVRFLATADPMRSAAPAEQLLVACEVVDRARTALPVPLNHRKLAMLRVPRLVLRRRSPIPGDRAQCLSQGNAADDPQALLAALALVYAGLWPDDSDAVARRLADFDGTAPHEPGALTRLLSGRPRPSVRAVRARWREQVAKMN